MMSPLRIGKNIAYRVYLYARFCLPIWRYALNRKTLAAWKQVRTAIGPMESEIVSELQKNGIAVRNFDQLFSGLNFNDLKYFADSVSDTSKVKQEFMEHEKMIASRIAAGNERTGKRKYLKDFVVEPWGSTGNNLISDAANPFIKASLYESVLLIAGLYMGILPRFRAYHLRFNLLVPTGTPEYFSQRWHRDPEDRRMLKMFIYMTDVPDAAYGPFVYINGSQPGGKYNKIFPQRPPASTYPEMGAVEKAISAEDIKICLGKAGTVIFADTSGLHKGGYTITAPRLMYTATYFSDASLSKSYLKCDSLPQNFSFIQRFAVSR